MDQPSVVVVAPASLRDDAVAIGDGLWSRGLAAGLVQVGDVVFSAVEGHDALVLLVDTRSQRSVAIRRAVVSLLGLADEHGMRVVLLTRVGPSEEPSGDGVLHDQADLSLWYRSPADLPGLVATVASHLLPSAADLTVHPPASRPGAEDAGVVVAQVEGLLVWAERVVADEARPEGLRDEVDARRRQLRDELRLIEQGRGSSAVLTGISGALLDLVRPTPSEDGLGAALDEVADGLVALGEATTDDERVSAGEATVDALDHVGEEVAEVIEAHGWDDLKASAWRTAGAWVEEDSRAHLNAFLAAVRERALPAGGAATGAAVGLAGGPPWLAVTIVAAGLLRSLFPWIFPLRDPPSEG